MLDFFQFTHTVKPGLQVTVMKYQLHKVEPVVTDHYFVFIKMPTCLYNPLS